MICGLNKLERAKMVFENGYFLPNLNILVASINLKISKILKNAVCGRIMVNFTCLACFRPEKWSQIELTLSHIIAQNKVKFWSTTRKILLKTRKNFVKNT